MFDKGRYNHFQYKKVILKPKTIKTGQKEIWKYLRISPKNDRKSTFWVSSIFQNLMGKQPLLKPENHFET